MVKKVKSVKLDTFSPDIKESIPRFPKVFFFKIIFYHGHGVLNSPKSILNLYQQYSCLINPSIIIPTFLI